MDTSQGSPFVVRLTGTDWRADLAVRPPEHNQHRDVEFSVPALGGGHDTIHQRISAMVLYTEAENRETHSWPRWHVKIYRCRTQGEAEALRRYLCRQATDVQRANAALPEHSHDRVMPPWAVVPVHVVRGDGELDGLDGAVRTSLAMPPTQIREHVRNDLPSWFVDGQPSPELYLFAVSPYVDRVDWRRVNESAALPVSRLAEFRAMATGLDTMHRLGMVHCDIKPDNVCRYEKPHAGFVLIDIDAVTRLDPLPTVVRATTLYQHKGMRQWLAGPDAQPSFTARTLVAHDRFGFAIMVLMALAGRDRVETELLCRDADPAGPRPADDRRSVENLLRRWWPDTGGQRWTPLARALSVPFGTDIETAEWSAAEWIEQLVRATSTQPLRSSPPTVTLPVPRPRRASGLLMREVERVRTDALSVITPSRDLFGNATAAARNRANAVAGRQALIHGLGWFALLAVTPLLLCIVLLAIS